MYNVIVGTAGHVDHGKTCLIKALTGVDTDRLKEEKTRGITIDLGFAGMPNDRGLNIGVIDVPGHERFISNMLAGIGGIDLALLVIAADEGVMPQTVEHFEILKILGIGKGIIAITKADLVDEEWMEIVRDDIKGFIAGTFLENSPVIEVSSHTGRNIATLRELICDIAEKTGIRRTEAELLRIPIDRVFTIDGFGNVVTGTLIEGTVSVGDEVSLYPQDKTAKVRNLQIHGSMADKAFAGQRTALNLTNIKKEELHRGDVIAAKGALRLSRMLNVRLTMFKSSARKLKSGSRLHLHLGSAEVLCKAILLETEELERGQSCFAQLRLEEGIAVRKGDRFVLRFYSPLESIGGGVVLHVNPPRSRRYHDGTIKALSVLENGNAEEVLEQLLLDESRKIPGVAEIGRLAGLSGGEVRAGLGSLIEKGKAVSLSRDVVIHADFKDEAEEKATALLRKFHEDNPMRPGMPKEEFRKRLGDKLFFKDGKPAELLISKMIETRAIDDNGDTVSAKGFSVKFTAKAMILKEKIENEYMKRGYEAPETEEMFQVFKDDARQDISGVIEALTREGRLTKLAYNCFMHSDCFAEAKALLEGRINEKGRITLSEYRDMLGTSRKYAVRLLEYMDQIKITRLTGDERVLI